MDIWAAAADCGYLLRAHTGQVSQKSLALSFLSSVQFPMHRAWLQVTLDTKSGKGAVETRV